MVGITGYSATIEGIGGALRVALVHYWLVNWRGGEQVLRSLANLFPAADIFTHVLDPELVKQKLPGRKIETTFISKLPGSVRHYQKYLPLMPMALEHLDLRPYDLVISSESGPAKGVIVHPYARHLCYCHSPMRYAWDMYHDYIDETSAISKVLTVPLLHYLRNWDQVSSQRVDAFAANSAFVAARIRKYYRREAVVIHPPVETQLFSSSTDRGDYFLWVGQLVKYKRPDLLVEAFNTLAERVVVIGEGEMLASLRDIAKPNVEFKGRQGFDVLREHYSKCRALIFPGVEDFGMVPVEAMASGAPVIALARGGALETVEDGVSGVLFQEQSVSALVDAVARFRKLEHGFDRALIQLKASRFSEDRFRREFTAFVNTPLSGVLAE